MVKELWSVFPRLMEEKINALLDEAEPNPVKAFHLYKLCQGEGLWSDSFDRFRKAIQGFFEQSPRERRKSHLDRLLERPAPALVFENFHLDFRTASINNHSLLKISSWAHHLMRVTYKTTCSIISEDVLTKSLQALVNPGPYDKARNFEFNDFCQAWRKTVFRLFGKKHDPELERILADLRTLQLTLEEEEKTDPGIRFTPTLYLTQTEIDWATDVMRAVQGSLPAPEFPLRRGPGKPRLMELERALNLYKIVQSSRLPELVVHRENIRATILDRCGRLLRECAR